MHSLKSSTQPSQCFSTSCTVSSYTTFPMLFYIHVQFQATQPSQCFSTHMYSFKLHSLPNTFLHVQFQATQPSQCSQQAIWSCLTPAMAWSARAVSRVGQFITQATGQVNCQMKHSTKIQGVMLYSHIYNMETYTKRERERALLQTTKGKN